MRSVVLIVLDGWGLGPKTAANALSRATLRTFPRIVGMFPSWSLAASGIAVGLPWGEPGNSEAGHVTMGAGKIIYQHLPRITLAIRSGEFFRNEALQRALAHVKTHGSKLHVLGLLSSGTVHSSMDHLWTLMELAAKENLAKETLRLHLFTDGRDSHPHDGKKFVRKVQKKIEEIGCGNIDSLIGRHWALDRNENWDRTQKAYAALTEEKGVSFEDPVAYLEASYEQDVTDEFIEPGRALTHSPIRDGDAVIFFDYREDSARQLTRAFVEETFDAFPRKKINNLSFVTFTEYERGLNSAVAFPPEKVVLPLGKILAEHGVRQFRIAETEKYAHITYFFNGLKETPFDGEERVLVKSLEASRFASAPEMRGEKITEVLIEKIRSQKFGFLLANYANADMIAHTGDFNAAVKAAEFLDKKIGEIIEVIEESPESYLMITGDHGNIDDMLDLVSGEILTEHSANPVPCYIIGKTLEGQSHFNAERDADPSDLLFLKAGKKWKADGTLADIAPTVLHLLGIPKPDDMSGESLLRGL